MSEPPPRKFFDGRKKGNESSKFKLLQTLNNDLESIYRPDSTLLNVSDKALINSIYPPNYKDQLGLIKKRDQAANLLSSRKKKLDYKPVYIHEIDDEDGDNFSEKNLDQNIPRETNKLVNTNLFRLNELSTDKSGILTDETKSKRNMMDESHTSAESHNESANEEDNEEYEADPELEAWQAFTVDLMTKTKKGPQKTLPVIGASRTDVSSKSLKRVKKATGALFELPGEADFELIRGPSSYLEVYKKHFKIRSSAKDRLAVANQLQNRKTDKKFF